MVTCDVKGLSEGSGAYGTLLTVKGKVISDLVVSHRGAAGLFLTVRAQAVAKVCESLERYIIVDDVNLKHRPYPAARGRQAALANRDIIKLFERLRVSDSFLLQNNLREILFRKPTYEIR